MTIAGRAAVLAAVALICAATATARAQERTVKIGVLSDMSSLFSENSGPGSLVAARLAVEDFNPAAHGLKVEIVSADHQNKADIGANIARQWFDVDHVDAIVDMATSSVALAVSELTREKNKVLLVSAAAIVRSHRTEVFAEHDPLDLRHLDAGAWHRQGDGEDRRRHLVLHHCRLCLRPGSRARHHDGRACQWRQGARQRASSDQCQRLLFLPAAGASLEGEDHRTRQCRRRHRSMPSSRAPNSA